jgi:hypothetical protein
MPARIRITRGINVGTVHEIQVNFLRIGSDLSCDLCIPSADVPAVAFLVEYVEANKYYRVHCRAQDICYFNGRLMNLGDKRDWAAGQELTIGRSLCLELELDENPSPCPPESRREKQQHFIEQQIQDSISNSTEIQSEDANSTTKKTEQSTSKLAPILVIFFCLAVSAFAVLNNLGILGSVKKENPVPTYKEVLTEIQKIDDSEQQKKIYLRLLTEAQRNENREIVKQREIYIKLRNIILQDRELEGDHKRCEKTLRYINKQIQTIPISNDQN